MLDVLFNWPPILLMSRALLSLLLAGSSWILGLYFVRYLRPSNVRQIVSGKPVVFQRVSLMGQSVDVHFEDGLEGLKLQIEALRKAYDSERADSPLTQEELPHA